jgi:hypothetical protein
MCVGLRRTRNEESGVREGRRGFAEGEFEEGKA